MAWNDRVAALAPWAWYKMDEAPGATVLTDASGFARDGSYPNGSFLVGSAYPVPTREQAPLVDGSTFGVTTYGGGNSEIQGAAVNGLVDGGSFTFGGWIKTTSTAVKEYGWGDGTFRCSLSWNHDGAAAVAESGTLTFWCGTGTNANALVARNTGWNDGNPHLILVEHDVAAVTMSVWLDGTRIATRSRVDAYPTVGTQGIHIAMSVAAGIGMDEFLCFDKVLTETEHGSLMSPYPDDRSWDTLGWSTAKSPRWY